MKKLITLLLLCCTFGAFAQSSKDSIELRSRLNDYMNLTQKKDFDKLMDFIHPSLFRMASKEMIKEALVAAYSNAEVVIDFDSMTVNKVSQEYFVKDTAYRRVDYSMLMIMKFTDKETASDTSLVKVLIPALEADFPGQAVRYDKQKAAYIISGKEILMAIRDPSKKWQFLGVEKENAMLMTLFSKDLIDRFKLDQ